MSTIEKNGELTYVDENGNEYVLRPKTKIECVDGLEAQLASKRPNTWTPTASEVGARPNTWMPTASDVGAVPTSRTVNGKALSSNITLSASDVGALDLGWITDSERQISTGDNLDNYIVPDAYRCMTAAIAKSLVNGPNYRGAGFRLIVAATSHNSVGVMQIAVFNALTPKVEVRVQNHSGEWGAWDTLLSSGNVETASASNNYFTACFTKIGNFVSCTLKPKVSTATVVYEAFITIPSGYIPATSFNVDFYSQESKNAGGDGIGGFWACSSDHTYSPNKILIAATHGTTVGDGLGTYCWLTA